VGDQKAIERVLAILTDALRKIAGDDGRHNECCARCTARRALEDAKEIVDDTRE
jgi:hypothetical protein